MDGGYMITIQSEELIVTISELGAEIVSIKDKQSDQEYIWQADPKFWNRHAPILFPIIGKLKDNSYCYEDQTYQLSRHGFARDMDFQVQHLDEHSVSLNLKSSAETMVNYPFEFSLQVNYIVHHRQVTVSYEILNPSTQKVLYYNIGGHPAFNVSTQNSKKQGSDFDHIEIKINPAGHYFSIPLTDEGLIDEKNSKFESFSVHKLTHDDFKIDTKIVQIGQNSSMELIDFVAGHRIVIKPSNMNWMAIWSTYPNFAGFVSIESWAGIPDDIRSNGAIDQKRGIEKAEPNELNVHSFTMDFIKL